MHYYRPGAIFGAIIGLLVYLMLPIYSNLGEASILPTGNVISDSAQYQKYVANLPFSVFIWLTLEILGIAAGIAAMLIFRRFHTKGIQ